MCHRPLQLPLLLVLLLAGCPDTTDDDDTTAGDDDVAPPTGLSTEPAWTVSGGPYEGFGTAVAAGGDVDGDGFPDVLVGSAFHDGDHWNEGAAFLYRGADAGPDAEPVWVVLGGAEETFLGSAVVSAGDMNGDAGDDVIVAAYEFDKDGPGEPSGRVLLFLTE